MLLKSWTLELAALVGTLAFTGGMIGLLVAFDDQPVFDRYNITLNTIISAMSVVMKALVVFSAAKCIEQWK